MARMQIWKEREIEKLKEKPVSYLEEMIKELCHSIEQALLRGKITEADKHLTQAKLYAWAKKEKLKEK